VANACSAAMSCSSSVVVTDVDGGGSFSSSGMSMLQCAACGIYAHRSCAFARPAGERNERDGDSENEEEDTATFMPLCEVNLPLVQEALNLTPIKKQCTQKEEEVTSSREQQKGSTDQPTDSITPVPPPPPPTSPPHSTSKSLLHSPWSIFGRKSNPETETDNEANDEQSALDDVSYSGKQTTKSENNNKTEERLISDKDQLSTEQYTEQPRNQCSSAIDERKTDQSEEDIISIALSQDKSNEITEAIKSPQETQQNQTQQQQQLRPVRTSIEIIRKTSQTTKSISKASAVGMVAGGVAGLAIAGPAGVVMGAQIGKTVMAVGAAVEGTVSVGVLVVSLAAAAKYGIAEKGKRELALEKEAGELGDRTLILVRPDIEVDPIWGVYTKEARKSWEEMSKDTMQFSWGSGFGNLFSSSSSGNVNSPERDARYRHDSDIVRVDSSELATRDKVFLLVNRILNDKMSLPGYIYRHLIRKHIVRSAVGDESVDFTTTPNDSEDREVVQTRGNNSRSSRHDAHGIIKHVTAALLEVRPGLASSPSMTEMSATAVEMLVFGEIYNEVFDEIAQLTKEQDNNLSVKMEKLFANSDNFDNRSNSCCDSAADRMVSQQAIAALSSLPEAHTSTDKLSRCVEFLECVSAHFTIMYKENDRGGGSNDINQCIDADTLLKMVCQHIIAARVKNLHAEVLFMEEFSRDEQLLRGKEGYALITLQASLHYLDSLNELQNDLHPDE